MLAGDLPFDETTMIDDDHGPAEEQDETPTAVPAPRAPEAAIR